MSLRHVLMAAGGLAASVLADHAASAAPAAAPAPTPPNRAFANPPANVPEPEAPAAPHGLNLTAVAPPPSPAIATEDAYIDPRQNILYDLSIQLTKGKIYNPWTLKDDNVVLRSYHGRGVDPATPYLAPTITMRPGQTVRIKLANALDKDADGKPIPRVKCTSPNINEPHCFNDTNLHAHGLWVSPTGNSDNVLISINPGVTFDYEYNVPSDHPAGTFWYHPHKHGSTALQVSSGMDGALIIKDDRVPAATTPGDIDILLVDGAGKPVPEKLLLFQQVQYACFDDSGLIIKATPKGPWACPDGKVGEIRDYKQQFSPAANWPSSGRFTSINGRVQPDIDGLKSGQFERWRLIHGGVRESVNVRFAPMRPGAPDFKTVPAAKQNDWIKANCGEAFLPSWEIALDGLTRSEVRETQNTVLQPGYRADLMVYFPAGGRYCVIDAATGAADSPSQLPEQARMLAVAVVDGGVYPKDTPAKWDAKAPIASTGPAPAERLQKLMTAAAERNIADPFIRNRVTKELADGMKLSAFVWHKPIAQADLNVPNQLLQFKITGAGTPEDPTLFMINDQTYLPSRIDRQMKLGDVQEWNLSSATGGHPFHIHVNPFQIISVKDAKGVDVTDPEYAGMIGQWKDTLFVRGDVQIAIRTRYERYIGEYVLHCHILDHEDQGMMQNVKISIPDGMGGIAEAHHH